MKATLRRTWPVLLSYALFSMWGVSCLFVSLMLTGGGFKGDLGLLGVLAAAAIGHVAGNALGLAGFRLAPIVVLFTAVFIGAAASGAVVGFFAVFALVAAFAALGGYLGVASRLDVVAAWYPLAFAVGGAVHWMNHHTLGKFATGEKHALWDPFSMVCLTGAAFLMLVFLATRHSLGLTVWQEVGRPKGAGDPVAVARPGRGSLLVLFAFTLVILGVTALVSPYLFRTTHGDGQGESQNQQKKSAKKKKKGPKTDYPGTATREGDGEEEEEEQEEPRGDEPDSEAAKRAAEEALNLGLKIFVGLLIAALLALLFVTLVLPPIRRALLLKHLEKPLWPVPPTARVMNLWRRVLTLLELAGVEPDQGELPRDLARRAEAALGPLPGLSDAAALVERVDYAGRGLGPEDEPAMRAALGTFRVAIAPLIPKKKKFFAAWTRTPEVES